MKPESRREKTVIELILRDNELLQLTTAIEGPLGYENLFIFIACQSKSDL
jgi:hypothetical protein